MWVRIVEVNRMFMKIALPQERKVTPQVIDPRYKGVRMVQKSISPMMNHILCRTALKALAQIE